MKTSTKVLIAILILTPAILISNANSSTSYMPLRVGNSWTYTVFINMSYCCKEKFTIVSDTVINGKKYFRSSNSLPVTHIQSLNIRLYRVDSLSGNFFGFVNGTGCSYSPYEILIDSLSASIDDLSITCPSQMVRECTNIESFPAPWNQSYLRKRFQYHNGSTQTPTAYFRDLGLAGSADGPLGELSYNIIGCVVNGTVYGDTTLTGIHHSNYHLPKQFSLGQNYPNTFNPMTIISYSLFESHIIELKLYDVLGNQVKTLVNERKNAGDYEVQFDGGSFPSGVYLYSLFVDGKEADSKRMILLK
ncbi:MAG: T9SS type A sorting domain-containing protein [Ignavibacteria bacterium]